MIVVLLAVLAVPGAKVAVLDLVTPGLSPEQGQTLSDSLVPVISAEVSTLGHGVMSSADIRAMLSFDRQKTLLGCNDDTSCLAEIGGALGADLLLSGTLAKLGDSFNLTLTLLDIRTAEVKRRFQGQAGSEAALPATVRRGVQVLFEQRVDALGTGTLFVKTDPEGGTVFLDGKEVGRSPLTIDEVTAGDHVLVAKKDDKEGRAEIRLAAGALERISVTLVGRRVKLKILSTPPDAQVELDGAPVGTTPLILDEVPAGAHSVRVTLDEYFTHDEALTLDYDTFTNSGGLPFKVDVALEKKPTLFPIALTAAAGFGLNARGFAGLSPLLEVGLAPGWFELTLGAGAPLHLPVTLRAWLWREGLQLGLHARVVAVREQPLGQGFAFVPTAGLSFGYGLSTELGLVSARLEPALAKNRDNVSIPVTLALAWRL